MMNKEIWSEYKQGRKKNYFVRNHGETYFLEKITKGCGYTIKAGTEKEVMNYINENGFKFVGLVVMN